MPIIREQDQPDRTALLMARMLRELRRAADTLRFLNDLTEQDIQRAEISIRSVIREAEKQS